MPSLTAPEVAQLLREFGQRTALRGGNPYRAKAYTRAAENLLALTEPPEDLIAHARLFGARAQGIYGASATREVPAGRGSAATCAQRRGMVRRDSAEAAQRLSVTARYSP